MGGHGRHEGIKGKCIPSLEAVEPIPADITPMSVLLRGGSIPIDTLAYDAATTTLFYHLPGSVLET